MDSYKLDIFRDENPSKALEFLTFNAFDSKWLLDKFLVDIGCLSIVESTQNLFTVVEGLLQKEILYKDCISKTFLKSIFDSKGIKEDSIVFIIWDYNTGVDIFKTSTLLENWDYIWYDTSDEAIILYLPSLKNVFLLSDHGLIKSL